MNQENNFIPYQRTEFSSKDLVTNSEKYYKEWINGSMEFILSLNINK